MARTRERSWTRCVNTSLADADERYTAHDEELEEEDDECEEEVEEEDNDDDQRCGEEHEDQVDAEQDDVEEAEDDEREEEEEEDEDERPSRDMPCKRGDVAWRTRPSREPPGNLRRARSPRAEAAPATGPTPEAARACVDELSSFLAFLEPGIQETAVRMTNLEAARREAAGAREQPGRWRSMDATDFRAYVGLLILSGVYRSRGEAAESLWDSESGRAIFRATMSLKRFRACSSLLRFDDRRTRGDDRLAPIRRVWEAWSARLPLLYAPGPEVTVDERLVPFRGRCPFRQYMPNKPARYGIKLWVTCDAKSSYAWKMNVYAGSEKAAAARGAGASSSSSSSSSSGDAAASANLSTRVVLDCTEGLPPGRNVTCDNFFTSHELASRLHRQRGLTLLGTLRANKPEIPLELLQLKGREARSSLFAFAEATESAPALAAVSYLAKKKKNVLILSTAEAHVRGPRVSELAHRKPLAILDYNRTKGGVDNLDKVLATYSCRRKTCRWPLALFHNIVDVSAYNAFVIFRELRPGWMAGKLNRRRVFLERLGRALVSPLICARERIPREPAAARVAASVRASRASGGSGGGSCVSSAPPPRSSKPLDPGKRKRCAVCPRSSDAKTRTACRACFKYICGKCTVALCPACGLSEVEEA